MFIAEELLIAHVISPLSRGISAVFWQFCRTKRVHVNGNTDGSQFLISSKQAICFQNNWDFCHRRLLRSSVMEADFFENLPISSNLPGNEKETTVRRLPFRPDDKRIRLSPSFAALLFWSTTAASSYSDQLRRLPCLHVHHLLKRPDVGKYFRGPQGIQIEGWREKGMWYKAIRLEVEF